VLYLLPFESNESSPAMTLENLYRKIVPDMYVDEIRVTGVMGGITVTTHPILDCICWFVHPCRTADALQEISGGWKGQDLGLWDYLLLWFGVVGTASGLNVPVALVRQEQKDKG
jgi:ubiquitin-like-conjugating enzyme ATG10